MQYLRDGGGAERALPVAADAYDGTVGAARIYPRASASVGDAAPALPPRPAPQPLVRTYIYRYHAFLQSTGVCSCHHVFQRGLGGGGAVGRRLSARRAAFMRRVRRARAGRVPDARGAGAVRGAAALAPLPGAAQGDRWNQLHSRPDTQGGGVDAG